MKRAIVIIWLSVLAAAIGVLFWYNDWVYSLPTPVPLNYKAIIFNEQINLPAEIKRSAKKPLFLHFFNPVCPCSRFNMPHFKSLVKKYGDQADFVIVALSKKKYSVEEIQDKFGEPLPVVFDESIATACGVYSTPQAVIIDEGNRLFYRGNYNANRYCTDERTEYARMALDALLHH